jgi:hypothetical protein
MESGEAGTHPCVESELPVEEATHGVRWAGHTPTCWIWTASGGSETWSQVGQAHTHVLNLNCQWRKRDMESGGAGTLPCVDAVRFQVFRAVTMLNNVLWHRLGSYIFTDVSQELATCVFRFCVHVLDFAKEVSRDFNLTVPHYTASHARK